MERTVFPLGKSKAFSLSPDANHTCRPSTVTPCTCSAPGKGPYSRRISAADVFMTSTLEQIRVGWNRQRRSTAPVNLLYPFEVDRIHFFNLNRGTVPPDNTPIKSHASGPRSNKAS